jgi:hypothetical protein
MTHDNEDACTDSLVVKSMLTLLNTERSRGTARVDARLNLPTHCGTTRAG